MMSVNFYFLLLSKVMTFLVKRMHVESTLKVKLRVKTNQTSNQNFPTPFFKLVATRSVRTCLLRGLRYANVSLTQV